MVNTNKIEDHLPKRELVIDRIPIKKKHTLQFLYYDNSLDQWSKRSVFLKRPMVL